MGRTFASRAIADLVRLVGRLSVDAFADPTTKPAHRHFVSGYLTALEATGIVPHAELLRLKHTCEVVLDGNLTLQDLKAMKTSGNGNDTDPTYLRAVTLVNRAHLADADLLASQMDTSPVQARRLIERMQADGIVNEPDLFGIRTLKAQPEVRHG
jgi:DNA segregation ATPase FtsK/SpoIIIE-like protein